MTWRGVSYRCLLVISRHGRIRRNRTRVCDPTCSSRIQCPPRRTKPGQARHRRRRYRCAGLLFLHFDLSHIKCCTYTVNACGSGSEGVQTKTFVVDFASADDARWEALLEELKPIEVGVLGASVCLLFLGKKVLLTFVMPAVCECRCVPRVPRRLCRHIPGGASYHHQRQRNRHAAHHQPYCTFHGLPVRLLPPLTVSRTAHADRSFRRSGYPITSKKGLILNMGSFAGAAPTPMLAVYSASKSFLRTWSEGLAAELTPKGVIVEHVNTYYVVRLVSFSPFSSL
jgi:hypothetical protein